MNHQNFYLRLISLLLIIMAVFFYNGTVKYREQAQAIAELSARTEGLEKQQEQILTALREIGSTSAKENLEEEGRREDAAGEEETPEEETPSDDSGYLYENGTFEGSGTGYGGSITVQVTLADDTITAVHIISAPGEDSAYLSQGESIINSIISEQSTDIDTISGATFSSAGILEAVNDALSKAEK